MRIKNLLFAFIAGVAIFSASCQKELVEEETTPPPPPPPPSLADSNYLSKMYE